MNDLLTQQILDLIYRDGTMRRKSKDALSDWILDTQSRTDSLGSAALIEYLTRHQPDLFERLKSNLLLQEELTRTPVSVDPS